MKILLIGTVGKAHGLRGEVLVHPFYFASPLWKAKTSVQLWAASNEADSPESGQSIVELPPTSSVRPASIAKVRPSPPAQLVVAFEGCTTREQAEALRGARIGVAPEALPEPAAGEVYHHEIGGWEVVRVDGTPIGTAGAMLTLPAQDVLEVILPDGSVALIPFVDAIVTAIDRAQRRITIDPPLGLLPTDPD